MIILCLRTYDAKQCSDPISVSSVATLIFTLIERTEDSF